MKHSRRSAFTLVEVLTGIVVIAVVSSCSWFAVSTLFRSEQVNRNRNVAVNLLQKSQEELRKASLSFYDNLNKCQFPGPAFGGDDITCGLQTLAANFNGYTRSVTVSTADGSSELKKAVITVNWVDQGKAMSMNSAVLLARPPDPLPGNIIGTVRTSAPGNALIKGAQITVKLSSGTTQRTTTSNDILGAKNENFDFFDQATGAFVLPVGNWTLTATHPSYYNYSHSTEITVHSNAESRVDFLMDPKPKDATVNVRLINGDTGSLLTNFYQGRIHILDDYQETGTYYSTDNVTSWSKTISFNDASPRILTVNTIWAYRSGHAGKTLKKGPTNCIYEFNPSGWSSAVMRDETSTVFACTNTWHGAKATDRITVNPGETITVNVPLFPVPQATVRGRVVDQFGTPLAGAKVYSQWPTGEWWVKNSSYQFATTDTNGEYTYSVPAMQEMFVNNASGGLRVQARRNMSFTGCCDTPTEVERYSNWVVQNNLFTGSSVTLPDLVIVSGGTTDCGNVQGNLKNGLSGSGITAASISVQGVATSTVSSGDYIYQCPGTGYRLPIGLARFYASQSAYYNYDSGGNNWYSAAPSVNIKRNQMVAYDAKLWPIGTGNVVVTVLDAGTRLPINGAVVKVTAYTGSVYTLTTGADGKSTFNNLLETWPAVDLPADLYYNHTVRTHSLNVTHPSGFYKPDTRSVPLLEKGQILEIPVYLEPAGGT